MLTKKWRKAAKLKLCHPEAGQARRRTLRRRGRPIPVRGNCLRSVAACRVFGDTGDCQPSLPPPPRLPPVLSQQPPRPPILLILRFLSNPFKLAQRDPRRTLAPGDLVRRKDVPRLVWDDISHKNVNFVGPISAPRPAAAVVKIAQVPRSGLVAGRLHLNPQHPAFRLNRHIVRQHVTPGLQHPISTERSSRHKHHLDPRSPLRKCLEPIQSPPRPTHTFRPETKNDHQLDSESSRSPRVFTSGARDLPLSGFNCATCPKSKRRDPWAAPSL